MGRFRRMNKLIKEESNMRHVELNFSMMDKRHMGIGGSDANIIWRNDREELNKLYNTKGTINKDVKSEDLSDVFPVQMGILSEELNIKWFEKRQDYKVLRGGCYSNAFAQRTYKNYYPFFCHTDGIVLNSYGERDTFLECKHTNPFGTIKDKITSYMPQLQFYMMHLKVNSCWLSIIRGNAEPIVHEIESNAVYQEELNGLCCEFWDRVQHRNPYIEGDNYMTPHHDLVDDIYIDNKKDYDMKDTEWDNICDRLDQTAGAVDIFNDAKKELKALVPKDASKCTTETSKWIATSGKKSITLRKKKEGEV